MNRILAIETSGKFGSIAIATQGDDSFDSIISLDLPRTAGSAQTLAQSISLIIQEHQIGMKSIGCIALVNGPGSFTGLRVGIATAKSMAYALGISVVGLDTLDVIHLQAASTPGHLDRLHSIRRTHAMLDAYRGQIFIKSKDNFGQCTESKVADLADFLAWCHEVEPEPTAHAMVGPGVDRVLRFLERELEEGELKDWSSKVSWFGGLEFEPHAKYVAKLGLQLWEKGEQIEPIALLPNYFRGSAAEEKAKAV